jgi:hypothetical protein
MVTPSYYSGGYYDYGYAVRCVPIVPSIRVNPTSATFPGAGSTKKFTVTTTDFAGTPTIDVEAIDDATDEVAAWITTASISGSTLTVTTAANDGFTSRTATITLTAGTVTVKVNVSQDKILRGVLAAPGVIGYIEGTNTLTLKGSVEYKKASIDSDQDGTNDIEEYAIANFGGLENQTVYVAHFKFGSLVAISGDPTDEIYPYLEPEDIVATPLVVDGHMGLAAFQETVAAEIIYGNRWGMIPVYEEADYDAGKTNVSATNYHNAENIALGKGDPCMYYFGTKYDGGWKLPTGNPYNGTPNYYLNSESDTNLSWKVAGSTGLGEGLPAGRLSTRTGETGMFYPGTGLRYYSGGEMRWDSESAAGFYWSSDATYDEGTPLLPYQGFGLYVSASQMLTNYNNDFRFGFAVRCVRDE